MLGATDEQAIIFPSADVNKANTPIDKQYCHGFALVMPQS